MSSDAVEAQTHNLLEYGTSSVTVTLTYDTWAVTEPVLTTIGVVLFNHNMYTLGKQDLDQVLRRASATLELGRVPKGS